MTKKSMVPQFVKDRKKAQLEQIADVATQWIGSTTSLVVHTLMFIVAFLLPLIRIMTFEKMLLVLTTVVSLEAIYLAIFIQMSVNKNSEDIEEIQEDIEEIQEDVEEIQEDVEEIQEDVEEIQEDMDEEEEEKEKEHSSAKPSPVMVSKNNPERLRHIENLIRQLQEEVNTLKGQR